MKIAKGRLFACVAAALVALSAENSSAAQGSTEQALINRYCVTCHNDKAKTAGLSLASLEIGKAGEHAEVWERVVQRLATRTMPPAAARRPDEAEYGALVSYIEAAMNRAAAANPNPGRVATFRRLNPTEYQNAIRERSAASRSVVRSLRQELMSLSCLWNSRRKSWGHGSRSVSASSLV